MAGKGAPRQGRPRRGLAAVGLLLLALPALGTRTETTLATKWRFHQGEAPGAEQPAFDDHAWNAVSLPHTWNAYGPGRRQYRGPSWYRLSLVLSPAQSKQRLFLRFGAASLVARVYLNGQKVGEHRGGFSAFCLPISRWAKPGANELAVWVDNSRNLDVPPLSGDFDVCGGLYRGVRLLALDEVGVSPLDEGGPGVYLTPRVSADGTAVDVRTVLLGDVPNATRVVVQTRILDAKDAVVATGQTEATVTKDAPVESTTTLRVPKPHLWDGVRDPYLYHARVRVFLGGRVVDEVVQPLGLRAFRVDPERGFVLNGRPYDLHGVNVHQGRPSVGWAATSAMQDEDYALVREMGCTAVRMAHYPHADHETELCDRLGIAVWAELPLVNQLSDTAEFRENAAQQLRELIKQNYNHPSVVAWSLYNEPWIDKVKGEGEWHMTEPLARLARSMDPSRLVTGAMNWGPSYWLTWVGDVASQNHYWGWYDGRAEQWPTKLDEERQATGGRSFGISEYGAGASVSQHEASPRQPVPASRWHPEEWQSHVHETVWPALEARPWLWCKFVWAMFDFPAEWRNEGDRPGINDKGLVTGDRRVRKDAFFYYKAQWSNEPFVYLTSRRFSPRPTGSTEIKAYSNLPSVRLSLDGHDLGAMTKVARGVFVIEGVPVSAGRHTLRARGDGKRAGDHFEFVAAPSPP